MMNLRTGMLAAVLASGFGVATAHATVITTPPTINLTAAAPDVNLPFVATSYAITGTTGVFTSSITGDTGSLNFGASSLPNVSMNLTVNYTEVGSKFIPTTGSIDVFSGSTHYFTSPLAAILGYSYTTNASGSQAFEFLFAPGSGTLAPTKDIGIILHTAVSAAPDANFDVAFNNNAGQASAQSDTFAVNTPEPASLSLLGLAAPLILRRRRASR